MKLCIVSLYNYPLFNPNCQTHFGGWEVRTSLIAKELAKRGRIEVSIIVADHGQPHIEERDGVKLVSWRGKLFFAPPPTDTSSQTSGTKDQQEGSHLKREIKKYLRPLKAYLPWWCIIWGKAWYRVGRGVTGALYRGFRNAVRVVHAEMRLAANIFGMIEDYPVKREDISLFDEVDADMYVVPGNHAGSAIMAYYCKRRRRKYVFLAGSALDYKSEYNTNPEGRDIYDEPNFLKAYAIKNACVHIVQNAQQAAQLKEGYGRTATLIRNPIDLRCKFPRNTTTRTILWVGTSDDRIKRPSLLLTLAEKLPNFQFYMIMKYVIQETHERCLRVSGELSNLTVLKHVPFDEVERYFADACIFVNTSAFEGFPNTFLQAAKYGVPIVALDVDPGAMLSTHNCGFVCGGNLELLKRNVQQLMSDADLYAQKSADCLNYVRTYHDKDKIIPQYEQTFYDIWGQERRKRKWLAKLFAETSYNGYI